MRVETYSFYYLHPWTYEEFSPESVRPALVHLGAPNIDVKAKKKNGVPKVTKPTPMSEAQKTKKAETARKRYKAAKKMKLTHKLRLSTGGSVRFMEIEEI